jgi:hypothetical protein
MNGCQSVQKVKSVIFYLHYFSLARAIGRDLGSGVFNVVFYCGCKTTDFTVFTYRHADRAKPQLILHTCLNYP